MMDLLLATSGGEAQAASGGYVDDVFSAYVRTGTGADITVNTNIDMTKGYMLWTKGRSGATDHAIYDSARGVTFDLASNLTSAQTTQLTGLKSVSGTGHTIGSLEKMNTNAATYVDWVFRKSPKFFDVVTYTGNGASNRQIPHSLGVAPGMIIIKRTDSASDWVVWHRSTGVNALVLNNADIAGSSNSGAFPATQNSAYFTTGTAGGGNTNANGATYVAYLFAHDPSAEGIIQCGSFTTDGSGNASVNLGWEPQYLMFKKVTASDWNVLDVSRGWNLTASQRLYPNQYWAEEVGVIAPPNSLGFSGGGFGGNDTYIYLAIRRPNKPSTSGTQVYNASIASGVASAGFPVDLHIGATIAGAANNHAVHSRLVGGTKEMVTSSTAAEATITDLGFESMTGLRASLSAGGVNHFFRRAHGFFDVVCDTGTGVAHAIAHNLTKAPELIIRKSRSAATQWEVWHSALAATEKLVLNSNAAKATDATAWGSTLPTATQFTVGTGANVNANAATFVTYLFATLAGISKVGSYTGNGSSQTIDCGFSTGARFVLIKRTDAAGDWYVWDSVRGIVAANDPHLSLNTTAAEVITDDSIDPASVGFIVNQNTATNINVNGGQYIFLAIA